MRTDTHTYRLLDLLRQKGILCPKELDEVGIPRVYLTRLAASGQLEKAGRGLYRFPDSPLAEYEGMMMVARRAPQAVFCLLAALQFHEVTT